VHDRVETGEAGELTGAAEAAGLTDLGEQMAGEHGTDPVGRLQRQQRLVVTGKQTQLLVESAICSLRAEMISVCASTVGRACTSSASADSHRCRRLVSSWLREHGQPSCGRIACNRCA
jgi:hypothetical protein